ncbi:hypothetical protein F5Y09DRAFT_327184 [Xylaria sp. FL1042]|nr:hypothetical protein F5Y09DRAFT_327184 [Xylaria sp. FL1042]
MLPCYIKADETYEQIWELTFGLVFFATPHRGGNHAVFGDVVAEIARSMLRNPGNTFMATLKSDSHYLSTITDKIRQMLEDFQILSFYDTRPLGRLSLISITSQLYYECSISLILPLGCRSQISVA